MLIPSLLPGDDLLEFHQAVVSTLRDADDMPLPLDPAPMAPMPNPLMTHTSEDMARLSETHGDMGPEQLEDEADTGKLRTHLNLFDVCCWMFAVFSRRKCDECLI